MSSCRCSTRRSSLRRSPTPSAAHSRRRVKMQPMSDAGVHAPGTDPAPVPPAANVIERGLGDVLAEYESVTEGAVADYIPELATVDPDRFGIALASVRGHVYSAGDDELAFTIQSSSKPFVYALAIGELGSDVVERHVGFEPSGEPFNAISLDASHRPARQPAHQRRRHRDDLAHPRWRPRRPVRADPPVPLCVRRAPARGRRGRVPVGARHRRPQPGAGVPGPVHGRARVRRRGGHVGVLPAVLDPGDGTRPVGHGGDARQQRRQPDHRRDRDARGRRPHDPGRDGDVRDVQLQRRVDGPCRPAGQERRRRRDRRRQAGPVRRRRVQPPPRRPRQQRARRAGARTTVVGLRSPPHDAPRPGSLGRDPGGDRRRHGPPDA